MIACPIPCAALPRALTARLLAGFCAAQALLGSAPVLAQAPPASPARPESLTLDALRTRMAAPLMSQPLIGQQPLVPLATTDARAIDDPRTLRLQLSAGAVHDSNVLRGPQARADQAGFLTAGLRLDKRYGLQHFQMDAEVSTLRFDELTALDHELLNYRGAWNFAFTPRLTGALSASQVQVRDFSDVDGAAVRADLRTEREQALGLRLAPGGRWRAEAGASRLRTQSDQLRTIEANARIDSLRLGLGWQLPSGLDFLAQMRRGKGDYPDLAAPDFKDTALELLVHAPLHAAWSLNLRAGAMRRRHDAETVRDFEGAVGDARLAWEATARTRIEAGAERVLGSYDLGAGGQVRASRLFIAPAWQAGAHTTLSLRHAHEWRDWVTVDPLSPDVGRSDRSRATSLLLDWQPRRMWQLLAQVRGERRGSSLPGARFRATVSSLTLRLTL